MSEAEIYFTHRTQRSMIAKTIQLNRSNRFWDTECTILHFENMYFFRAFRKNSIKVEQFNIFRIGFHQSWSNIFLYHGYKIERDPRISIERLIQESSVAKVDGLIWAKHHFGRSTELGRRIMATRKSILW